MARFAARAHLGRHLRDSAAYHRQVTVASTRRMTPQQRNNLKRLLAPRHVAFIGGDGAALAAQQCAAAGFDGPIWGVNPHRSDLAGQPCFARVEDLPEPPDAVFLAVPRGSAVETVDALRRFGAAGVVCYTAGFSELGEDGAALERDLVEAAGEIALVGPNCSGLLNYARNAVLWPFDHGGVKVERGVAFVTQSGMLGNTMTLNQRSVPFAYVISAGNQAMLSTEDYLEVLVEDPAVSAIGLYIESLRDIPRFADGAVRALEVGVPIVALKVGTSEIGARLTVTHTGSLSGTDDLYQALFNRLGVVRVTSPVALLETLKMLTVAGAPKGRRLAALACSGGDTTMLADCGERAGISFPQPSPGVASDLAAWLPPIAAVSNPLDYTTPLWGHEEPLTKLFGAMLSDGYDAAVMVQDYPISHSGESHEPYLADARAFIAATRAAGIPAAICTGLPETIDRGTREMMIAGGIAPLQGLEEALGAIAGAASFGEHRAKFKSSGSAGDLRLPPLSAAAGDLTLLDEWEGKQRIAAAGVPVPDGRLVDARTSPAAAEELGFPVVVKMVSAELPHKTEAGAVRVGLRSTGEVAEAVAAIAESVAGRAPGVVSDAFLVERMIGEPVAELLVGVQRDDQFGQFLVLASGGALVELVRDSRTLLLPTDRETVAEAIASLKVSALLDGYRGKPPGDREALTEAVLSVARFARQHQAELGELDINPLMVLREGVVAVDVLLRMTRSTEEAGGD
ncbi:MAG: acetate--CoA ligase family protein [Kiloniellales bacterium]